MTRDTLMRRTSTEFPGNQTSLDPTPHCDTLDNVVLLTLWRQSGSAEWRHLQQNNHAVLGYVDHQSSRSNVRASTWCTHNYTHHHIFFWDSQCEFFGVFVRLHSCRKVINKTIISFSSFNVYEKNFRSFVDPITCLWGRGPSSFRDN